MSVVVGVCDALGCPEAGLSGERLSVEAEEAAEALGKRREALDGRGHETHRRVKKGSRDYLETKCGNLFISLCTIK